MGMTGYSRSGTAQPATRGSTRRPRGDGRLDPVRWRRPGRGLLIRLTAVAALLATAAAVSWSHPQSCGAPTGAAAVSPAPSSAAAAPPPDASATGDDTARGGASGAQTGSPVLPSSSVGVPVRLADPTALALVLPGNHVDLLRLDDEGGNTTAVATAALVLKVTGASDPTTGGLLLALTPAEARQAVATPKHGFAIVIRPG
jgi:hypothetical protein